MSSSKHDTSRAVTASFSEVKDEILSEARAIFAAALTTFADDKPRTFDVIQKRGFDAAGRPNRFQAWLIVYDSPALTTWTLLKTSYEAHKKKMDALVDLLDALQVQAMSSRNIMKAGSTYRGTALVLPN